MNRRSRIAATAGALAAMYGFSMQPALSAVDYSDAYVPPKILARGASSSPVTADGIVVVQVQVNADGTHKVVKIIRSTAPADNKAALEIADSSTYRTATRGGKSITAFYDYTLKFTGAVKASGPASFASISKLNRAGNYPGAKAQAQSFLAKHPGNRAVTEQLAVAQFFLKDYAGSAQSFSQLSVVSKPYRALAATAFVNASIAAATAATPDVTQAQAYAHKALALDSGPNSNFALGMAQLAAKNYPAAVDALKKARDQAFADKRTNLAAKQNLDSNLLEAYIANNQLDQAQMVAADMKKLDPTETFSARILGNYYLTAGSDSVKAKQYDAAIKQFDQAAAVGDSAVQVTAYVQAAFAISSQTKPDYAQMKSYADKALAIKSDDATANFAEGVALTGQYVSSKKADLKTQATDYCNKAIAYAQAAKNDSLVATIQSFMKTNLK